MNFQERFKGRIEKVDGKHEPGLSRPVEKAVKAYQIHSDLPIFPIKTAATAITRPLSFRSNSCISPNTGYSLQSTRSQNTARKLSVGRRQDAPFQLVASNSLALGRPVDFSGLEESSLKIRLATYRIAADTRWMEHPTKFTGLMENPPRDYRRRGGGEHITEERRYQNRHGPINQTESVSPLLNNTQPRDLRFRSLSDEFA